MQNQSHLVGEVGLVYKTDTSTADIGLTKRLKQAGETLGIGVDDHIILTGDGYLSMKSRGLF